MYIFSRSAVDSRYEYLFARSTHFVTKKKKKLAIGGQSFRVRYLPVCKYRSGMTKEAKKIAAYW